MRIEGVEVQRVQALEGRLRPENGPASFAEMLSEKLAAANGKVQAADAEATKLLMGNGTVHETMIALERADLTLRMVSKVRNKVIDAYQNLSRMQI
ncbi:MAG: flagellar hook-basal body complex protein FliE [Myxococcales bacterium]|nr:flagellar hook-basal body complex protein FliE [Myxococcales bacterium]|tara:strand:+ start:472 stop:759 length:288 start_codon:yes stop_codon:yes gene_type:complete